MILHGELRRLAIPARAGETVRLTFRHSIHGSAVEEEFTVAEDGLRLVRLRYAEARVAEFYGHDDARRDGEAWVVDGLAEVRPSIVLRVSRGSGMRLTISGTTVDLEEWIEAGDSTQIVLSAGGR